MGGSAGLWARKHMDDLPREGKGAKAAPMILLVAGLSCIDDTGWLPYSMARLADESRQSVRATQEAVRLLSRMEFLVQGSGGFRLSKYIGGGTDGGTRFRRIKGRDSLDSLDASPSSKSPELSKSPALLEAGEGERKRVTQEIRDRVWAPVLGKLMQLAPRFRGFTNYESLELLELGREIVIGCPVDLDDGERGELALRISIAACETGMARGRKLRVVCSSQQLEEMRKVTVGVKS